MNSLEECKNAAANLKSCMNFKWTDDLTLQFVLYRHERRHLFTKKRNTSRHGWQQILRIMGLTEYVTPYQAQKKWNNLWSRYKLAKKAQDDGTMVDDTTAWPLFTVLDAIASGKNVSITSSVASLQQETDPSTVSKPLLHTIDEVSHLSTVTEEEHLEPPFKKSKNTEAPSSQTTCWEQEADDKQQIIELLQANLQQLVEVKQAVETQGQAIVEMLSQLVQIVSNGAKSPNGNTSGNSRIDEAISATIREIGIPHENV